MPALTGSRARARPVCNATTSTPSKLVTRNSGWVLICITELQEPRIIRNSSNSPEFVHTSHRRWSRRASRPSRSAIVALHRTGHCWRYKTCAPESRSTSSSAAVTTVNSVRTHFIHYHPSARCFTRFQLITTIPSFKRKMLAKSHREDLWYSEEEKWKLIETLCHRRTNEPRPAGVRPSARHPRLRNDVQHGHPQPAWLAFDRRSVTFCFLFTKMWNAKHNICVKWSIALKILKI